MARVVQRRGNPPYLLILFVFLFLLSATLAIVFYNSSSDNQKAKADTEAAMSQVVKPFELNAPEISSRRDKARSGGTSVLGQMNNDLRDCVTLLMGNDATAEQAIATAKALNAPSGLVAEVTKLNDSLKAASQRNDELAAQNKQLQEQVQADQASMAAAEKAFSDNMKKLQDQLTSNQSGSATQASDYQTSLDSAKKDWTAKLAEKDGRISLQAQELQKLKQESMMKDNKISMLETQLAGLRPKGPGEQMTMQPDGKIIHTVPQENRAYIDLGDKDRIHLGMTFAVYDGGKGVSAEGKGKAILVVTNVLPDTSECRVVEGSRENPVLDGDVVANLAYDSSRSYTFVVEGEFDLNGDGKVDPQSTQRIKDLIASYGGKIVDTPTVDTDFVVMGVEPTAPLKPGDTAPATEQQLYKDRLKEVEQYKAVRDAALNLQVPVLNTNRFLALVGYVPGK